MFKDYGNWTLTAPELLPSDAPSDIAFYNNGDGLDLYDAVKVGYFKGDVFFRIVEGAVVAAHEDFTMIQDEGHFVGCYGEHAKALLTYFREWALKGALQDERLIWTGAEIRKITTEELPAKKDEERTLTRPQFTYLLAITEFDDVWEKLETSAKSGKDLLTLGMLKAERDRKSFRLDRTLAIVAQFRATASQLAPEVDLSEKTIRAAWAVAEGFKGAGA